jgi:hypothetical protein
VVAGSSPTGIGEGSVSDRSHSAVTALARMLRKMTPSEQDPPAVAAAEPPRAGGQVVAVAVALLEAAALKRFAPSDDMTGVVLAAWRHETNRLPPQRPRSA